MIAVGTNPSVLSGETSSSFRATDKLLQATLKGFVEGDHSGGRGYRFDPFETAKILALSGFRAGSQNLLNFAKLLQKLEEHPDGTFSTRGEFKKFEHFTEALTEKESKYNLIAARTNAQKKEAAALKEGEWAPSIYSKEPKPCEPGPGCTEPNK